MEFLPFESFEGGMTDNYIDGPINSGERMDNILINKNRRMVQRPGFGIYSSLAPQIPAGNQSIDSIYYFDGTLFAKSSTKLYFLEDGSAAWHTLTGPTGNDAFADSSLGAKASWSETRGHLFITPGPGANIKSGSRTMKVYRRSIDNQWVLVQAGLPRAALSTDGFYSSPTYTTGAISYRFSIYLVFYRSYSAKVNGVDVVFEDFSSPIIETDGGNPIDAGNSYITSALFYANAAGENYDTLNMRTRLYRTKAFGTIPYFAVEDSLGGSIQDGVPDDELGAALYSGVTDGNFNDPPPKCYFHTFIDSSGWYGSGIDPDSGALHTNRVWQGKPGDFDSVPSGNFADIEIDKMSALSHAGTHPVVFSRDRHYRLEGRLDSFGNGVIRAILISAIDGAVSQDVAKTTQGIYFISENGFCYTDGFRCLNLSREIDSTFGGLGTSKASAMYDGNSNRVYFGVENPLVVETSGKNNGLFVLDENYIQGERGCFTTASSNADMQPSALHYDSKNQRLLMADSRGYVFVFDDSLVSDPIVDTGAVASTWSRKAVIHDYISPAVSFGSNMSTKWVSKIYLIFKNLTGALSLDVTSYNDDEGDGKQIKAIRERTLITRGLHEVKRWFKKGGLRCTYKQIQIRKGLVVIATSDEVGINAITDNGGSTALLPIPWPTDGGASLVGHFFYTEFDGYAEPFTITVHSGDTLTVADPNNTFPTGSFKWTVRGYPKEEGMHMMGMTLQYETSDNTFVPYSAGGDGENA